MKNYTITVNGNVYDVTVEEGAAGTASAAPKALMSWPKLVKDFGPIGGFMAAALIIGTF